MTRIQTARFLICLVASAVTAGGFAAAKDEAWQKYSEQANGDVYFYDTSRLKSTSDVHTVWMRIRYKRNVMAAASYQSLLEVDCSERTERTLQRTFFTDRHWEQPAMKTDMKPKKKRVIRKNSANERLADILCAP